MKIATLAIITRGSNILLGLKQGGSEIGDGTLNGPGGKMETTDRDTLDCVIRETWEEVRIALDRNKIEKVAIITFYFGGEPSFEVHVYRTSDFTGTPFKTKSMIPKWYEMKELPVLVKERMLESDRTWFPRAVSGEKFCANVYYKEKAKGFLKIDFLPFIDHE